MIARTQLPLSEDRLQRLRPSDIDTIRRNLQDATFISNLENTLGDYLSHLRGPLAVELDDVSRIVLQMEMAGVWDIIDPVLFINAIASKTDRQVIIAYCNALNIEPDPMPIANAIPDPLPAGVRLADRPAAEPKSARGRGSKGTVKWFNPAKGYGFISPSDGGKDVFIHVSAVQAAGLRGLNEGETVWYEEKTERGKVTVANLKGN